MLRTSRKIVLNSKEKKFDSVKLKSISLRTNFT